MLVFVLVGCSRDDGQEFCYETVIVTFNWPKSEVIIRDSKIITIEDFPEVNLARIQDQWHWYWLDNLIRVSLELRYPGRGNVLHAISQLEGRKDILRAEVSWLDHI